MAHIEYTLAPHFTGHIGPVRFRRGHAETDDAELVAYFALQPERYAVTETDEPAFAHDDNGHPVAVVDKGGTVHIAPEQ